jgi:hypothetical protein
MSSRTLLEPDALADGLLDPVVDLGDFEGPFALCISLVEGGATEAAPVELVVDPFGKAYCMKPLTELSTSPASRSILRISPLYMPLGVSSSSSRVFAICWISWMSLYSSSTMTGSMCSRVCSYFMSCLLD